MSRNVKIKGPTRVEGTLKVAGDKSISHRLAILASMASGESTIDGYASSADCQATLDCIQRLGVEVRRVDGRVSIRGRGLGGFTPKTGSASSTRSHQPVELNAANSGSTIRMLSGLLAGHRFDSRISGDQSLNKRPMRRIIDPLSLMGAKIEARDGNFPPLTIFGDQLHAIRYESPVASAQVKTCILLAGLLADGETVFLEPVLSRNHTELMLNEFGVRLLCSGDGPREIRVQGGSPLSPVQYTVPGDLSSAAFFIAAAAMDSRSRLVLENVGLNPTRAAFLDVVTGFGARIETANVTLAHGEQVGDIKITGGGLRAAPSGGMIRGQIIPNIIDEIPILAVLATQVEGRTEVRDAAELRIKESDRIRAVAAGIRALGGTIEEFDDGFAITGPQHLTGGSVDAHGDHRIAMAFSIAGLAAHGTTHIIGAECASVSFPEFYALLSDATPEGTVEYIS